jgi:Glycosyl transferase family group 2
MLWLSILVLPLLWVCIDAAAGRARHRQPPQLIHEAGEFRILVPIWGQVKYLLNIPYLSQYGSKVTLCTTNDETDEFYAQLTDIACSNGFQIYRDGGTCQKRTAEKPGRGGSRRATSGTIRDGLIRRALAGVEEPYVVPLDADSTTTQHIAVLVGELVHSGFDIASIRVVPANPDESALTRLQRLEYGHAMQLRFIVPWMISGACHVAKTAVLRDVMNRHSLFFQGNDIEIGVLAKARGYNVGHIPFEVLTDVPARIRPFLRQRIAWAGGEFRLFIVNSRFILKHPFLWIYGGVIAIGGFVLRWMTFITPGYGLITAAGLYIALVCYLHWYRRSRWVLLMPLYTLFSSMIMTPLGIIWYFKMAIDAHNWGVIRPAADPPPQARDSPPAGGSQPGRDLERVVSADTRRGLRGTTLLAWSRYGWREVQ